MRGETDFMTVLEGDMRDHPVQFLAGDLVLIMGAHAALCMIGTMDQHMTGVGALIMGGQGVLNMADIAGIVFIVKMC